LEALPQARLRSRILSLFLHFVIPIPVVPYGHRAAINNKNSPERYRHANAWRIGVADVSVAGFIPAERGVWGGAPFRRVYLDNFQNIIGS